MFASRAFCLNLGQLPAKSRFPGPEGFHLRVWPACAGANSAWLLMTDFFSGLDDCSQARAPYARLSDWIAWMPTDRRLEKLAEAQFRRIGITFAAYGEGGDADRLIPFDMFPRVFSGGEWGKLKRGIKQHARGL
jgi:hypothetical protein